MGFKSAWTRSAKTKTEMIIKARVSELIKGDHPEWSMSIHTFERLLQEDIEAIKVRGCYKPTTMFKLVVTGTVLEIWKWKPSTQERTIFGTVTKLGGGK